MGFRHEGRPHLPTCRAAAAAAAGETLQTAVSELQQLAAQQQQQQPGGGGPGPAVHGTTCNVGRPGEVAALADFAVQQLGSVDLWIK